MDDHAVPGGIGSAGDGPVGDDPVRDDPEFAADEPSAHDTGDSRVDAALTSLDRLAGLPVSEHAPVFERVHAELTEILGDLPESAGTSG
jgi:hypothetical protein